MSNHTNDPWETEMSRTFDQRVRDLHEAPLSLDQVKGKAVRIRRNRRIAVAGGIVAAAAVIVPVVGFAGGALTDNDTGPDVANPDNPKQSAKDLEGLGFDYLEGDTLHLADGTTVRLPARYDSVTLLGDTVFATLHDDETGFKSLDLVDDSGDAQRIGEVIAGPVANSDHTLIAYVETDGDLITRWEGGEATIASGLGDGDYIEAVTGGPDCETDDCRIYVSGEFGTDPLVYDANGGSEIAVPDVIAVNGVEGGIVTVQTSYSDEGSCGGVYDLTLADYHWESCDYFLFEPSPDAQHVDATHPYLDGFGNGWAAILDATTGQEVIRFDPPEGTIVDTAWQDPAHLLALVYDSEGWSVYRIGVDQDIERVLGPDARGNEENPSYRLLGN